MGSPTGHTDRCMDSAHSPNTRVDGSQKVLAIAGPFPRRHQPFSAFSTAFFAFFRQLAAKMQDRHQVCAHSTTTTDAFHQRPCYLSVPSYLPSHVPSRRGNISWDSRQEALWRGMTNVLLHHFSKMHSLPNSHLRSLTNASRPASFPGAASFLRLRQWTLAKVFSRERLLFLKGGKVGWLRYGWVLLSQVRFRISF